MTAVPLALIAAALSVAPCDSTLSWRRMGPVTVCLPPGEARSVVFLLSGDDGWTPMMQALADALAADGALVAGIKTPHFLKQLNAAKEKCAYPAADFETLSQYLQKFHKLTEYHEPLLIGFSSGAALSYATAEQAPSHIFKGVIGLGFYAELSTGKPWCYEHGLLKVDKAGKRARLVPDPKGKFPWRVIQGGEDKICDPTKAEKFVARVPSGRFTRVAGEGHLLTPAYLPPVMAAVTELVGAPPVHPPPTDPSVSDLPLVEVPAAGSGHPKTLALVISGDGGWASIDKEVAAELAGQGIATVGLNSLKYFWTARTPESSAADLERILRHYSTAWNRPELLLIGYSFGADVMPFVYNRLPADLRSQVRLVTLLALSETADFEFHLSDWLGGDSETARPTAPEIDRMAGAKVLCLQGDDEKAAACESLKGAKVVKLPGGHHFDGDYAGLTRLVLAELDASR